MGTVIRLTLAPMRLAALLLLNVPLCQAFLSGAALRGSSSSALGGIAKKGWEEVEQEDPGYGRRFYNDPSKPLPSQQEENQGNYYHYPKAYREKRYTNTNTQGRTYDGDRYYPMNPPPPYDNQYPYDTPPYNDDYYPPPPPPPPVDYGGGYDYGYGTNNAYSYGYDPNYRPSLYYVPDPIPPRTQYQQAYHPSYRYSQPYRTEPYQQLQDKQRQKSPATSSNSNSNTHYRTSRSNADELFHAINEDRGRYGMPLLLVHPAVVKAAQLALSTMDANQSPIPLSRRLRDVGYYFYPDTIPTSNNQHEIHVQNGATLTTQSVQQAISTLLNNPKNRDQILSQKWQHMGVATNNNGSHWIITLAAGGTSVQEALPSQQVTVPPPPPTPQSSPQPVPPPPDSSMARVILDLVNVQRQNVGLPPLRRNVALEQAAQSHAYDMVQRQYYSHTTPEGYTAYDRVAANRYSGILAENIATGSTPEQVLALWMASPEHCETILSKDFIDLGVGVYADHWVQLFGGGSGQQGNYY